MMDATTLDIYARLTFNQAVLVDIMTLIVRMEPDQQHALTVLDARLHKLGDQLKRHALAATSMGAEVSALYPHLVDGFLDLHAAEE